MAAVSLKLDRDLEARVSKYADGIGVPLEEVVERALVFALKTRYDAAGRPDNSLPGGSGRPDNSLPGRDKPVDPGYGQGAGARPDQGLPPGATTKPTPGGGRPDQSLPGSRRCPVFDGTVDNELPEGEVPPEIDNELPETAEPK